MPSLGGEHAFTRSRSSSHYESVIGLGLEYFTGPARQGKGRVN